MTKTLAFEIGTEEIPAFDLARATEQLEPLMRSSLEAARIPFESIKVASTPRRLILMVMGLAEETQALVEEHKGPSAKIAFDESGEPTKAALGFVKSKGVSIEEAEKRSVDGTEYLYVTKHIPAQPVAHLLTEILESLISNISWPKSCRWGVNSEYFSRPVRWLLALLDEEVIPVRFAQLESGRLTCGHRVLSPGFHEVARASELFEVLEGLKIVYTQKDREALIKAQVAAIEAASNAKATLPEKTLLEVVNLTEHPCALMGSFDEEFLQVPEEIIVDAMLMHQRYFPLYRDGKLINKFILVSNGDEAFAQTIIDGNERVVRARLSDAKFFYDEDLKKPLEDFVVKLDTVVFQESLGTVKDKVERIEDLCETLADLAGLTPDDRRDLLRAAHLCKADLVTNAVIEFTSVQGVMGSYYAQAAHETDQVAQAIADHYRPRFSGDELASSQVGQLLACADKLDTICGLFAVGQVPSGSSDPFALRRSAIGIITMLFGGLNIKLLAAIDASLASYAKAGLDFDLDATRTSLLDFFEVRTKVMLKDLGFASDIIDAVLAAGVAEPHEVLVRTQSLADFAKNNQDAMQDLALAYGRAANLLKGQDVQTKLDTGLFTEAEHALDKATAQAHLRVAEHLSVGDYVSSLADLAEMRAAIDAFFDEVKVMDDDVVIRQNRLAMLANFISVFAPVADFSKLAK